MPDELTIDVKGVQELMTFFDDHAPDAVVAGTARGMYKWCETVMTKSKRLVPVRFGALRSSGQVEEPRISGNTVTIRMGYGNSSVQYAAIVHEDLSKKHKSPTQAKYLEQPALEMLPQMSRIISAEIEKELRANAA